MSDQPSGRAARLDRALADLLSQAPELEAAAVVSYDGLAMASALPVGMDEDRVAAMSAALLSLGEKAAQGLGRGDLSQVYVEGETGTVFLVSCDDEAVLVAVAAAGAKAGLMLFEVRRASAAIAEVLRVAAPPAPVAVDEVALAEAEAAYAAHRAELAEAERAAAPAQPEVQPAPQAQPTPVLHHEPVPQPQPQPVPDSQAAPAPMPVAVQEHAPANPLGTVYHPDTPLEPTPSLSLASWMTNGQPEPSRS
jgi:predicted regulator of Ras-like GTPase activity (Roadblock/LC7/MglB family)